MRLQIERRPSRRVRLVFEAEDVSKAFGATQVVRGFLDAHHARRSHRAHRSERRGQDDAAAAAARASWRPTTGDVRRGANVEVAYYDQQREQLDPERTVFDTVGERQRHGDRQRPVASRQRVPARLSVPAERAQSPVKALSGGERNRLLLARLFTRPANLLVLDEPTNDLDLETLELLEAQLVEWPGTLLLVSHDRVFLDNVVTSTLVFEGDGRVEEYVGGYEDWLRQQAAGDHHTAGGHRKPAPTAPGRPGPTFGEEAVVHGAA